MALDQKKRSTLNEKEWVDRFTKKEAPKKPYTDPNVTFKPQISKKTAEMLEKKGKRNAFEELNQDSKNRIQKAKYSHNI